MSTIAQQIHAVLFLHPAGLSKAEIMRLCALSSEELRTGLSEVVQFLHDSGVEILVSNDHLQLITKISLLPSSAIDITQKDTISSSALEVLAIIAYKQPISRNEIEEIRGVGSEQTLRGLLEKDLILETKTKKNSITTVRYSTSPQFLKQAGLTSLSLLPKLKETHAKQAK
ncbi:SMC-Scp complex subunit ScpB [Candidatus Saccharibacteria bacterium]|nr:SMC-Scp complex subunit ScpB [Candidatus Saccharibacteria bacterium]